MKKKVTKFLILIFSLLTLNLDAVAQENCKVLMASISVKYEGECKKGKAEGIGKAEGEDSYHGEFLNGLPDGTGKYTWKNGNFYNGSFKKGKRNGTGTMTFKFENKADSIVSGFWKYDKYIGLFEQPYIVHNKSVGVSRVSVEKVNGPLRVFKIVINNTRGISSISSNINEKLTISSIDIIKGSYLDIQNEENGKTSITILREVVFPIRIKANIGREVVDIEILETGNYTMNVFLIS